MARDGLMKAIGKARFGDIARAEDGGKGLAGVVEREKGYFNPFLEILEGEEPAPSLAFAPEDRR